MISREGIFSALFGLVSAAQISGAPAFKTSSRKLKHWSDVSPAEQPALFQTQGHQAAVSPYRQPTKWTLRGSLYVYAHQNSLDVLPAIALNQLVDAIELALWQGPAIEEQTLGGLVSHCRIVGEVETDEGVLGDQAVAIIPIEIQANA
jgi:hypothetical protein